MGSMTDVSTHGHARALNGSCWQGSPPSAMERLWSSNVDAAEKGMEAVVVIASVVTCLDIQYLSSRV